jgi:hypothetical protein
MVEIRALSSVAAGTPARMNRFLGMRPLERADPACKEEAQMFSKTAAALAAALVIGVTAPSMAGEGSSDITDWWNHDRGGAPYAYGPYAYGWSGWRQPGYVFGSPRVIYDSPAVVYEPRPMFEADINVGVAPRRYYWD